MLVGLNWGEFGVAWILTDVSSAMISSRLRSMVRDVSEVGKGKREREERRKEQRCLCVVRDQSQRKVEVRIGEEEVVG